MPETRKIRVKGKEIVFLLTFKEVKNLNLRIRKNGSVAVSAPRRTPLYRIDDFVRANAELVLKHTERAKEYNTVRVLRPGDTVFFLGDSYRLCFSLGERSLSFFDGGAHLSLPTDEGNLEGAYLSLLGELILPLIKERCLSMENAFPRLRGYAKDIRVKFMKSMWANCRPSEGRLTFSSSLASMPIPLIDGVVAHEYAHFFCRGHGKDFYAFLATISPDYKALSLALTKTKREQLRLR